MQDEGLSGLFEKAAAIARRAERAKLVKLASTVNPRAYNAFSMYVPNQRTAMRAQEAAPNFLPSVGRTMLGIGQTAMTLPRYAAGMHPGHSWYGNLGRGAYNWGVGKLGNDPIQARAGWGQMTSGKSFSEPFKRTVSEGNNNFTGIGQWLGSRHPGLVRPISTLMEGPAFNPKSVTY